MNGILPEPASIRGHCNEKHSQQREESASAEKAVPLQLPTGL